MLNIISMLFYLIPVAAIVFFVVSLCLYLSARKQNKDTPGFIPKETMNLRKCLLIVSSAILAVLLCMVIGLAILLYTAIAFM